MFQETFKSEEYSSEKKATSEQAFQKLQIFQAPPSRPLPPKDHLF